MTDIINDSDSTFDAIKAALQQDFKICLDVAGVLIIARDKKGTVVTINKHGLEVLGYPEDEIVGKNWFDFVAREEREESRRVFADIVEGRSGFVEFYERTVMTKNSEKRTLLFHNALIRDAAGMAIGILSSGEDVTNQRKLGESLAKEERLNEVVADNLPIGYCVNTISDGKAVFMNKKFEDIYGWPRDILVDVDSFFQHVYPDPEFRTKIKEQVMMDIMSAEPSRMVWKDLPVVRQSGETAYITAQNIPLYEYDTMISTVMDVSRQVRIEKTLRENERLQHAILNSLSDLVFVKDKDGKYVAANAAMLTYIHKRVDEVIGKTDFDVFPKEYAEKFQQDDAEVVKTRIPKRIKETSTDASGLVSWFETVKTPVYDGEEFIGIVGVARIMTSEEGIDPNKKTA